MLGPVLMAVLAVATGEADAASLHVTVDQGRASQAGLDPAEVEDAISSAVSADFHLQDMQAFMDAMAGAASMAVKGMGVDYSSNPEWFVAGLALGTGAEGGGLCFNRGQQELPSHGYSFQATAMAGLNLGVLGGDFLKRFVVFANGAALNQSGEHFAGRLENIGAHLQVRLLKPVDGKVVEWGGLAVTSGYQWSTYTLTLASELPVSGGDGLRWKAAGRYDLAAESTSVPVEVSTNLRVLFASAFFGAGLDLDTSRASGVGTMTGPVQADLGGDFVDVGQATLNMGNTGQGPAERARLFGGLQVNMGPVKTYGHLNLGLAGGVGGHLGLRVAR